MTTTADTYHDRVVAARRALQGTQNPILDGFGRSWDGSMRDLQTWIDAAQRGAFALDTATHDAAADFLVDLAGDLRRAAS